MQGCTLLYNCNLKILCLRLQFVKSVQSCILFQRYKEKEAADCHRVQQALALCCHAAETGGKAPCNPHFIKGEYHEKSKRNHSNKSAGR